MLFNTLRSEFTKLITTKSFWWTTAIFLIISWGWAFAAAKFSGDGLDGVSAVNTAALTLQILIIGLPVLMIQAIMVVTTEYRYGVQVPTYLANPNRVAVAAVKLLMYGVVAAILAFLAVAGAYLIGDTLSSDMVAETFHPFDDDAGKRNLWGFPLATFLAVFFAQGLGLLLRQTAGTVAVTLILFLGLDQLITFVPKIGDKLVNFSPFGALMNWLNNVAPTDAPWGESVTGYLWVFVAWAVALWVTGVALLVKRDA